jgi:hypothetical protein
MSVPTSRVEHSTVDRADDLTQFAFTPGDSFVRWVPYRDGRADDKVWVVVARTFQYEVSWERDERYDHPTRDHHRQYTLCSRTTSERQTVSEAELHRDDWRHWNESRTGRETQNNRTSRNGRRARR